MKSDENTIPRTSRPEVDSTVARHRLLSEPTRVAILLALRDGPASVHELAETIGVHSNTIRAHLPRLQQAGLVQCENTPPVTKGRPRLIYRLSGDPFSADGQRNYRALAESLVGLIRRNLGTGASNAAVASGITWGRHVAGPDAPPPGREAEPPAAVAYVAGVLDRMGFAAQVDRSGDDWTILLNNCPYREVAEGNRDVVCSFHLGLMRGVLDTLGGMAEVTSLEPLVEPNLCRVKIHGSH